MTSHGFQLYSLRDIDDSLATVLDRVGATRFTGVEFAGLDMDEPDAVAKAMNDVGVSCVASHVSLENIEADPSGVAESINKLGGSHVVVPWLGPEHFESITAVETAADRLSAVAEPLAEHGIQLHYHNHDQEFVSLDGQPALTYLLEAADGVRLELDVGWAGVAGMDPLQYLETQADRIDLVHLKDYDATARKTVRVGTGDLDLARGIETIRTHDIDWLIYEAEDGSDSYTTLDYAADIISGLE